MTQLELKITLITDGSSDVALIPLIKWLLTDHFNQLPLQFHFADFRQLVNPPNLSDINNRIRTAKEYYPFDILIYHRDAEENNISSVTRRKNEVLGALNQDFQEDTIVVVVPVRMMETWLLIDEFAIKKAAGNRNYSEGLKLPSLNNLERISNPKEMLHSALIRASGLKGRRLKKFKPHKAVHLVADNIEDYSPLRALEAFGLFENTLIEEVQNWLNND